MSVSLVLGSFVSGNRGCVEFRGRARSSVCLGADEARRVAGSILLHRKVKSMGWDLPPRNPDSETSHAAENSVRSDTPRAMKPTRVTLRRENGFPS
jgi:hypothetical protein